MTVEAKAVTQSMTVQACAQIKFLALHPHVPCVLSSVAAQAVSNGEHTQQVAPACDRDGCKVEQPRGLQGEQENDIFKEACPYCASVCAALCELTSKGI